MDHKTFPHARQAISAQASGKSEQALTETRRRLSPLKTWAQAVLGWLRKAEKRVTENFRVPPNGA